MKGRLEHLVATFDKEVFLNPIHKSRFYNVCRLQDITIEDRNFTYLATLFLLTAENKLWCAAKEHIYLDSFDFKKMHLNGLTRMDMQSSKLPEQFIQTESISNRTRLLIRH